jgi:hypothetical protein
MLLLLVFSHPLVVLFPCFLLIMLILNLWHQLMNEFIYFNMQQWVLLVLQQCVHQSEHPLTRQTHMHFEWTVLQFQFHLFFLLFLLHHCFLVRLLHLSNHCLLRKWNVKLNGGRCEMFVESLHLLYRVLIYWYSTFIDSFSHFFISYCTFSLSVFNALCLFYSGSTGLVTNTSSFFGMNSDFFYSIMFKSAWIPYDASK